MEYDVFSYLVKRHECFKFKVTSGAPEISVCATRNDAHGFRIIPIQGVFELNLKLQRFNAAEVTFFDGDISTEILMRPNVDLLSKSRKQSAFDSYTNFPFKLNDVTHFFNTQTSFSVYGQRPKE